MNSAVRHLPHISRMIDSAVCCGIFVSVPGNSRHIRRRAWVATLRDLAGCLNGLPIAVLRQGKWGDTNDAMLLKVDLFLQELGSTVDLAVLLSCWRRDG